MDERLKCARQWMQCREHTNLSLGDVLDRLRNRSKACSGSIQVEFSIFDKDNSLPNGTAHRSDERPILGRRVGAWSSNIGWFRVGVDCMRQGRSYFYTWWFRVVIWGAFLFVDKSPKCEMIGHCNCQFVGKFEETRQASCDREVEQASRAASCAWGRVVNRDRVTERRELK